MTDLKNDTMNSFVDGVANFVTDMVMEQSNTTAQIGGIAAERLRSIIERIERVERERGKLASDIKDIYAEAKSAGFDVPVLRRIIRARKQEPSEVEEQEALFDTYRHALGM